MEEVKKEETPVKVTEDTPPAKSVEELQKELKVANETNETLTKDKDTSAQGEKHWKEVAGRQSEELGDLRKKPEDTTEKIEDTDPEVVSETKILMDKDGMDKETALYNARLLVKSHRRAAGRRMGEETEELIREDWQDGKMDKKLFDENSDAIYVEVDKMKLSKVSARANRNVVRECYDKVLKKKAEELREANKPKDEEKRTNLIDAGAQAPSGGAKVGEAEDDKRREEIRNAGVKKDNAFF